MVAFRYVHGCVVRKYSRLLLLSGDKTSANSAPPCRDILYKFLSPSGDHDHVVLSCRVGVKVVNCETD